MTIVVRHPVNRLAERSYIFEVLFGDFLGLEFVAVPEMRDDILISCPGTDATFCVADVFFQTPAEDWLQPSSLPNLPIELWTLPEDLIASGDLNNRRVPILFGRPVNNESFFDFQNDTVTVGVDIFGAAFFMLTRYEEACSVQLDQHGRYPASASLAVRADFIERPLVNEYVEILWACFRLLFPNRTRKRHEYSLAVSHDVDRLFDTRNKSWSEVAKNALGDVTKRRDLILAGKRIRAKIASDGVDYRHEPSNTFDFIMDCSERHSIRSSFFFIPSSVADGIDGDYDIDMPWVRHLFRQIHQRGHFLGLHGSYYSFKDADQLMMEFSRLKRIAEEEGVSQAVWGGRQHYLRWAACETWQAWEDAGLDFDSTLAFPEIAGFRSGTCTEYSAFNLRSRSKLALRERPLVAMEATLFGENYMNLSVQAALQKIQELSERCREYNGQFTLLWHNDNLSLGWQQRFYRDVLDIVA